MVDLLHIQKFHQSKQANCWMFDLYCSNSAEKIKRIECVYNNNNSSTYLSNYITAFFILTGVHINIVIFHIPPILVVSIVLP